MSFLLVGWNLNFGGRYEFFICMFYICCLWYKRDLVIKFIKYFENLEIKIFFDIWFVFKKSL